MSRWTKEEVEAMALWRWNNYPPAEHVVVSPPPFDNSNPTRVVLTDPETTP